MFNRLRMQARFRPHLTALEWSEGKISYATLWSEVQVLTDELRQRGVRTLAVDLDNGPAWAILDLACLYADMCLIPLARFFSQGQLAHIIERAGVAAVVSDRPGELFRRLGTELSPEAEPLAVAGQTLSWIAIGNASRPAVKIPPCVHKITFTSGTTGEPKGVMLARRHIESVVHSLADVVGVGPADRHLALLPLAVLLENIGGLYVPLWAGATAVLPSMSEIGLTGASKVDGLVMTRALDRYRATTAIFTPQTLQDVIEAIEHGEPSPATLRFAAVGGAPVSPRLLQRAAALGLPVFEGYGLSECASVVCLNVPKHHKPGSVGRPLPHVALALSDDGEVVVQGETFAGYLGDAGTPPKRWPTGDLGRLDEDGHLHLTGRRRDIFITAFGRNVAPEWVERELTLEPAIAQAAVFGEARPWNSAVLVAADDADADRIQAAVARANAELPDYARVASWLLAGAPFTPANGLLTGTGRVRRQAVLAHYGTRIESLYHKAHAS